MLALCLSMIDTQEDRDKFEIIYHKYKGLVSHIALEYMVNFELVEDAAQEVFIKLIRYMDRFENMEEHKTFSFVRIVARNVCLDMLRKEKIRRVSEEKHFQSEKKYNEDKDFHIMLERVMSLPEIYRDVIMLKYYHGLNEKEISFITNISKDGVYKRLNRAKALLKEEII